MHPRARLRLIRVRTFVTFFGLSANELRLMPGSLARRRRSTNEQIETRLSGHNPIFEFCPVRRSLAPIIITRMLGFAVVVYWATLPLTKNGATSGWGDTAREWCEQIWTRERIEDEGTFLQASLGFDCRIGGRKDRIRTKALPRQLSAALSLRVSREDKSGLVSAAAGFSFLRLWYARSPWLIGG